MKVAMPRLFLFVVSILSPAFLTGCVNQQTSKEEHPLGPVVQIESGRNIKILGAEICRRNACSFLYGKVKRNSCCGTPMQGYLVVRVLSESGEPIQTVRSNTIYIPRNLPGKGIKWRRFEIGLPDDISETSRVIISAHQGTIDDSEIQDRKLNNEIVDD